jgi:hypothetical protein
MSDTQADPTRAASEGGIAATHSLLREEEMLVAPATAAEHINTIRLRVIPVACWRIEHFRFAFDSSLPSPELKKELKLFADLLKAHPPASKLGGQPGFPLSVFGHADPTGDDEYNKQLGGRRATAIYALLTRDAGLWEKLFSQPFGNDKWGAPALELILGTVSPPPPGQTNQPRAKEHERNVAQRKVLFAQYMDTLCGPELKLEKTDFLGHGDDKGGKADFQGCGEFNPALIFSQKDQTRFEQDKDKTARNDANAPNRRVMVLIFRRGSRVDPKNWPCPRVEEGTAGCHKRFWSDGEDRRSRRLPDKPRKFEDTLDTFACRFYDRLSRNSPCERLLRTFRIRLFDPQAQPIPGAPFVTVIVGVESPRGQADSKGDIILNDVEAPSIVTIRWSRRDDQRKPPPGSRDLSPSDEDSLRASGATEEDIERMKEDPPLDVFEFENDIVVDIPPEPKAGEKATATQVPPDDRRRLHNMGYSTEEEPEANLKAFQRDCETGTGKVVDDVFAELRKRHQDCDPPARNRKA